MRDFRHAGTKALALAIPAGMAISPRTAFVFAALWLLPEWVERWVDVVGRALDVRDRRRRGRVQAVLASALRGCED